LLTAMNGRHARGRFRKHVMIIDDVLYVRSNFNAGRPFPDAVFSSRSIESAPDRE
jgi:hypothetical protein